MYHLLEKMIESAEASNKNGFDFYNRIYSATASIVYGERDPELAQPEQEMMYDRCRQSCLMAVRIPSHHDTLMADAKQRFEQIEHRWNGHS